METLNSGMRKDRTTSLMYMSSREGPGSTTAKIEMTYAMLERHSFLLAMEKLRMWGGR